MVYRAWLDFKKWVTYKIWANSTQPMFLAWPDGLGQAKPAYPFCHPWWTNINPWNVVSLYCLLFTIVVNLNLILQKLALNLNLILDQGFFTKLFITKKKPYLMQPSVSNQFFYGSILIISLLIFINRRT